ncbi:MAG: hypothetical protein RR728_02585, partial [Oscillospiraceae bacterium]
MAVTACFGALFLYHIGLTPPFGTWGLGFRLGAWRLRLCGFAALRLGAWGFGLGAWGLWLMAYGFGFGFGLGFGVPPSHHLTVLFTCSVFPPSHPSYWHSAKEN